MDENKLLAILGITGAVVMCVFFICAFGAKSKSDEAIPKALAATQIVNAKADELSKLVDSTGAYIRVDDTVSVDPWNKPLGVAYSRSESGVEKLVVRSAGPDGTFETNDDIATERWLLGGE